MSLQVREADAKHKAQLASTKQQLKRRTSEELFDLRAKLSQVGRAPSTVEGMQCQHMQPCMAQCEYHVAMNSFLHTWIVVPFTLNALPKQERQAEISKVCAKSQRDVDDLKQQLAARGQELAHVKSFANEREGAADALAEELQQLRKESADREAKLREALQLEARRAEKQLAREKALTVVKTQEAAAANHQRELIEMKDRLLEEKQAALAEQKQHHASQVDELTRKLPAREEEKRSLLQQLEESRQSVAAAREEATRQLRQQLHEMRGVGVTSLLVCHPCHCCVCFCHLV